MGIDYRMAALLTNAQNDDELAEKLIAGYERLVDGVDGMGELYKVMGIYNVKNKHVTGGNDHQITGFLSHCRDSQSQYEYMFVCVCVHMIFT